MFNYQVEYAKHVEQSRHNSATEAETNRHNIEGERKDWYNAYESGRHNRATEALTDQQTKLGYSQLAETNRHNLVTESQTGQSIGETQRHNIVSEKNEKYKADTSLKSSKVGAAATKYAAKKSSAATKSAAKTSASASVTSASLAAQASKYATNVRAETAKLDRMMNDLISFRSTDSQERINEAKLKNSITIKEMEKEINKMNIDQKDRETLLRNAAQIEAANLAADSRLLASGQGIFKASLVALLKTSSFKEKVKKKKKKKK